MNRKFCHLLLLFSWLGTVSLDSHAEATDAPRQAKKLALRPIQYEGFLTADGGQFLAADEKGGAYLFHTGERSGYRLEPDGKATRLFSLEPGDVVRSVAVGDQGERWLFHVGHDGLRLVDGGVETTIDAPGTVLGGIGLSSGEPIVGTTPFQLSDGRPGRPLEGGGKPSKAASALLMSWNGKEWSTTVERDAVDVISPKDLQRYKLSGFDVSMAVDAKGRILIAPKTSYDVRLFSPAGKELDRIRVDGGERTFSQASGDEQKQLKKAGFAPPAGYERLDRKIHGLAFGQDNRFYFLVASQNGLALDRYDPTQQTVERTPISGLAGTSLRFVAADAGLLIADARDLGRVYVADWQQLENASWSPVADVELRPR
jgi:hypothetical protein